jgi:hypothetical protein
LVLLLRLIHWRKERVLLRRGKARRCLRRSVGKSTSIGGHVERLRGLGDVIHVTDIEGGIGFLFGEQGKVSFAVFGSVNDGVFGRYGLGRAAVAVLSELLPHSLSILGRLSLLTQLLRRAKDHVS